MSAPAVLRGAQSAGAASATHPAGAQAKDPGSGSPSPGLQRLRRAASAGLARARRFAASYVPPTGLGWTVALLSGLSLWWYGFGAMDLLLYVIGICGLLLLALSSLLVLGTAAYLRRHAARPQTTVARLEAASPIRTGFSLPALRRIPLVQLRWEWLQPTGVEVRTRPSEGRLLEEVVARRRAEEPAIVRRIHVESAFGLAQVCWDVEEPRPVAIFPWVGLLKRSALIHSLAAADGTPHPSGAPEGDRMEIRQYTAGDSARHIIWPRYAKTRELVVRTPERSVDRTQRIVAYLIAAPGDEPAAAAARVALETGGLGESWIFGADGTREPSSDLARALEAIARSGSLAGRAAEGSSGLATFLDRTDVQGSMHCIIYAPGVPGPWTPRVLETLRRRMGQVSFVLGVDGIAQPRIASLWSRLLWNEPDPAGAPPELLSKVSDMLARAGGSVVVADRPSGRYHGELHSRIAERRDRQG